MIKLIKENIFPIDPYNNDHLNLISDFERKCKTNIGITEHIKSLRKIWTKDEYITHQKENNFIELSLVFSKLSEIKDCCHLRGEKDLKSCKISFVPIKSHNRALLTFATEYAILTLGMEDVFITIDPKDKEMIKILESNGFENLGEENSQIIYLKEKIDEKKFQVSM